MLSVDVEATRETRSTGSRQGSTCHRDVSFWCRLNGVVGQATDSELEVTSEGLFDEDAATDSNEEPDGSVVHDEELPEGDDDLENLDDEALAKELHQTACDKQLMTRHKFLLSLAHLATTMGTCWRCLGRRRCSRPQAAKEKESRCCRGREL